MPATNATAGWHPRAVVTMTALGLVSGALSSGLGTGRPIGLAWLASVSAGSGHPIPAELLPVILLGLYFGLAMGVGIWLSTARPLALPVVLVTCLIAWGAAIQVGIRLQRTADDDPHLIAASLAAGAVGAVILHLGCSLFSRALRRPAWIALTTLAGAAAGVLLYASQRKLADEWLLYAIWQPAVAFCLGLGLRGDTQHPGEGRG
jgi:hypothetical protein